MTWSDIKYLTAVLAICGFSYWLMGWFGVALDCLAFLAGYVEAWHHEVRGRR